MLELLLTGESYRHTEPDRKTRPCIKIGFCELLPNKNLLVSWFNPYAGLISNLRQFDLNELDIRKNFKQASSSTGRIPDKNISST